MTHAINIVVLALLIVQLATGSRLLHYCPGEAHSHSHQSAEGCSDCEDHSTGHLHFGLDSGHDHEADSGIESVGEDGLVVSKQSHLHHIADCAILSGKLTNQNERLVRDDAKGDTVAPSRCIELGLINALGCEGMLLRQKPRPPDRTNAQPPVRLRLALNSLLLL